MKSESNHELIVRGWWFIVLFLNTLLIIGVIINDIILRWICLIGLMILAYIGVGGHLK